MKIRIKKKGEDVLEKLKNFGVGGIIKDISKISIQGVFYGNHREYTHKGWNFKYSDDKAHWNFRKELLIKTVEKVFGTTNIIERIFNFESQKKCEAISSIIYYIHILGDYFECAEDKSEFDKKISIGNESVGSKQMVDLYRKGRNTEYLIKSLKENYKTVFSLQTREYNKLKVKLEECEELFRNVNKNDYESYKDACETLKNVLIDDAPKFYKLINNNK